MSGKYRILTKRHVLAIMAILFLAGALVVLLAAVIPYAYANMTAASHKKLPICCTDRSNKKVSITFDVMQGDTSTDRLLEILKQYHVPATFFVTGEWAERYPDSLKALYDAGHEIMNGSDTYPHMPTLSRNKMIAQINTCSDKIQAVTGVRPTLFRAPYGDYDNDLMEVLASLKMTEIQWDVDSYDQKDLTADGIVKRVTSEVSSGSIVLFHNNGDHTVEALPRIIEKLQSEEYEFLPVSAMIYNENYTLNFEGRQIANSK